MRDRFQVIRSTSMCGHSYEIRYNWESMPLSTENLQSCQERLNANPDNKYPKIPDSYWRIARECDKEREQNMPEVLDEPREVAATG